MLNALKQNYGSLFEKSLIEEINQVGTLREVPEGFMLNEWFGLIMMDPKCEKIN